jgi:hypothetical protein
MRRITAIVTACLLWAGICAPVTGCNGSQVAQDIVTWVPPLQSAVATVDSTISLLAPADALLLTGITAGFDAASNLISNQAKAYLANPTATLLATFQQQILTFQQSVNAALLSAAKITNPASQQKTLTAVNGVATIISAILALVTQIKGNTPAIAAQVTVKTAQLEPILDRPYLHRQTVAIVAQHYGISDFTAQGIVTTGRQQLIVSGY